MELKHIIGASLVGALVLALIFTFVISYICYYKTFYNSAKKERRKNKVMKNASLVFVEHMDTIIGWKQNVLALPSRDVSIKSEDGLKLVGKYYETEFIKINQMLFCVGEKIIGNVYVATVVGL